MISFQSPLFSSTLSSYGYSFSEGSKRNPQIIVFSLHFFRQISSSQRAVDYKVLAQGCIILGVYGVRNRSYTFENEFANIFSDSINCKLLANLLLEFNAVWFLVALEKDRHLQEAIQSVHANRALFLNFPWRYHRCPHPTVHYGRIVSNEGRASSNTHQMARGEETA